MNVAKIFVSPAKMAFLGILTKYPVYCGAGAAIGYITLINKTVALGMDIRNSPPSGGITTKVVVGGVVAVADIAVVSVASAVAWPLVLGYHYTDRQRGTEMRLREELARCRERN